MSAEAPDLTPTEELLMEVLSARIRLGEPWWTFDIKHLRTIRSLTTKGLVSWDYGSVEHSVEVVLTREGRDLFLDEKYRPPLEKQLRKKIADTVRLAWPGNEMASFMSSVVIQDPNGVWERTYQRARDFTGM